MKNFVNSGDRELKCRGPNFPSNIALVSSDQDCAAQGAVIYSVHKSVSDQLPDFNESTSAKLASGKRSIQPFYGESVMSSLNRGASVRLSMKI
jgi:hypothetical protein